MRTGMNSSCQNISWEVAKGGLYTVVSILETLERRNS
jgi:hypothetical protein